MIVIGGELDQCGTNNCLYELSGDSEENLTWTVLDQKLDVGRCGHVSLPISNQFIQTHFSKQE